MNVSDQGQPAASCTVVGSIRPSARACASIKDSQLKCLIDIAFGGAGGARGWGSNLCTPTHRDWPVDSTKALLAAGVRRVQGRDQVGGQAPGERVATTYEDGPAPLGPIAYVADHRADSATRSPRSPQADRRANARLARDRSPTWLRRSPGLGQQPATHDDHLAIGPFPCSTGPTEGSHQRVRSTPHHALMDGSDHHRWPLNCWSAVRVVPCEDPQPGHANQ